MIDFDFHEIAFGTPLLALAIDALDRRADRQLLVWCALLLLVREDMGIIVAVLAVLMLAQRRGWRRPAGLFVVGIAAYLLVTKVVLPRFAGGLGFSYDSQFGELGDSVWAAGGNMLLHSWHALTVFFSPVTKSRTILMLITPFALLPLRSRYSWLAVPLLAERMLNSRNNLWQTNFHYNALPWLILSLAAVDGAYRLHLFEKRIWTAWPRRAMVLILLGFPVTLAIMGHSRTGIVSVIQLRTPLYGTSADWLRAAKEVDAWIPADVCVIAENRLVPHLTPRDWVSTVGVNAPNPDFIVLDMTAPGIGGNPPVPKPEQVQINAEAVGYRPVLDVFPFVVLQSPDYTGPSPACAPLGPGK
jgi:uncharacterized membrane protein